MAGLLSEILYTLRKKPDEQATKELVSKFVPAYNPPAKPPRPFEADYPKGALADEQGRLLKTIDGHDITGQYLVGRNVVGGTDQALPATEFNAIAKAITGQGATFAPFPGNDVGGVTVNRFTRRPEEVLISNKLSPSEGEKVFAHEIGHVVDQAAGEIPVSGIQRQARQVYNTLNTGTERTRNLTGPEQMGYRGGDIPRELMAEGIRAYATNPNYIKTVAPEFAQRIRETVNTDPVLSKIIQFNTVAPAGLLGAGYAMSPSDAEAAPKVPRPRMHGPSLTDAIDTALPSQPSQLSQARPDWIGENGAITANPPWLRPDPNKRSTIGKLYDAVTTNPVGTFKAAGSAISDAVKGYLGEVRQDPGKGVADALELGVTAMGGAAPQAFWMATSPSEANGGEDAILADRRRKMMQGLLAD